MYVNLSLDHVSYKEKPSKKEMYRINNSVANSPFYDVELSQVADLIGNQGHTFSGTIFSGRKRKSNNFASIQLFGLDFDDGVSYEDIKQLADYYNLPICFAYHTFSSTPEHERFRIVFLHDTEITDFGVAKTIIDMLKEIFPACDKNCSDVVRFFFGGNNGLLKYQEKSIKLTDVVDAYSRYMKEKKNSHYKRDMDNFAKRHNIAFDGKCLKISEYPKNGNFLPTTDNIYTELGKFLPNSDKGNTEKHPQYLIEGYQERNAISSSHPSENLSQHGQSRKGRFAGLKYAGRYCRLYREFDEGINIGHNGRFHILLSFLQIRDGKRLFLDIIKRTGKNFKKWESIVNALYIDSYEHERSCSECPYCSECDHDSTMLETVRKRIERDNVKKEVHILHRNENYISLEEGRKKLRDNIEQAIESTYPLTLIKAQAGIGKTYAYKKIIKEQYLSRKFLVALPNNMLKMLVGRDLIKRGIPCDNMV